MKNDNGMQIPTTHEEIKQTMLESIGRLAAQFENWSKDIQAIEVITAVGSIDVDIAAGDSDITNIANGKANNIKGDLKIVARTRFELDGDLLVLFPTKEKNISNNAVIETNEPNKPKPNETPKPDVTNETTEKQYEIDSEMLAIHNSNVNTAVQNLQFVFAKLMDVATEISRNLPSNPSILNPLIKK